jgi:hypothetical protein
MAYRKIKWAFGLLLGSARWEAIYFDAARNKAGPSLISLRGAPAAVSSTCNDQSGVSGMTTQSARSGQTSNSLAAEELERARIVAAFMALFVEQSIKKINCGTEVSLAQLREEFRSTITVLAARVEQIDRVVLAGESVKMAERAQGLAVLLSSVLRTWLDGADPDLARIMSALDRAGTWAAPHGLPRPGQPYSGSLDSPAFAAPAATHKNSGVHPL